MISLNTVVVKPWDMLHLATSRLASSFDTPFSQHVLQLLKSNDYEGLANLSVHPSSYSDPFSYRNDACIADLIRKSPHIPTTIDREAAAWKSSEECEQKCHETNQRLVKWSRDQEIASPRVWAIIQCAQELIAKTLGEFSTDEWLLNCKFGPGSYFGAKASVSDYDKLNAVPSCTQELAAFGPAVLQRWPAWFENQTRGMTSLEFDIQSGEKFSVVRKTAKTDRTIGIQPLINGWYQAGIGLCLRTRLNKRRLLLPTAQEYHREMARRASIKKHLATLDQSNASNLIATGAVRLLLAAADPGWLHSMELTRCKNQVYNGEIKRLHRFSSMGNAYTFELETLIFWAIAKSTMDELDLKGVCSVFGDDVILPNEALQSFFEVISFLGFEPNEKKSFSGDSPFRESCGGDYFDGVDVRSFFSKEDFDGTIPSLVSLANGVRRLALRRNCNFGCDVRLMACWNSIVRGIPRAFRVQVAFGVSDNDDLLLASRCKGGKKIRYKMRRRQMDGWFAGKATILYRSTRREPINAIPTTTILSYCNVSDRRPRYSGEFYNNAMILSMVRNANQADRDLYSRVPDAREVSRANGRIFNWKRDDGFWVFTKDHFQPNDSTSLDWL